MREKKKEIRGERDYRSFRATDNPPPDFPSKPALQVHRENGSAHMGFPVKKRCQDNHVGGAPVLERRMKIKSKNDKSNGGGKGQIPRESFFGLCEMLRKQNKKTKGQTKGKSGGSRSKKKPGGEKKKGFSKNGRSRGEEQRSGGHTQKLAINQCRGGLEAGSGSQGGLLR